MIALMTPAATRLVRSHLVWRTNRTPSFISESIELPGVRCGVGVGFIKNSALAETKKVAQSTLIADDVLAVAMMPPTAGPIMLPITLFDNGRTAFMAGRRTSGTVSGVRGGMHGMKIASNVSKSTAKRTH